MGLSLRTFAPGGICGLSHPSGPSPLPSPLSTGAGATAASIETRRVRRNKWSLRGHNFADVRALLVRRAKRGRGGRGRGGRDVTAYRLPEG